MARIESLLSARLFLVPQRVGNRIFFISDLSGRLSLYVMDYGGSVPEPLLPPHIALQNPHHIQGSSFVVFPKLGKILVMLDNNGDETYQPMLIPLDGDFPEPVSDKHFAQHQVHAFEADLEASTVYFFASSRQEPLNSLYAWNLATNDSSLIGQGMYGPYLMATNNDRSRMVTADAHGIADFVLYLQKQHTDTAELIYGTPMEERTAGQTFNYGFGSGYIIDNDEWVLLPSMIFEDTYGLSLLKLDGSQDLEEVAITGKQHQGLGELEDLKHLNQNRYALQFNIDGASWLYEAAFNLANRSMNLTHVLCGNNQLQNGVIEHVHYDLATDSYTLAFSTATSPTQLYTIAADRSQILRHTNEHILGLTDTDLAAGEDASFTSHDGLRISARLYLPSQGLGLEEPFPIVYYIHGGPQGQERPNFAWFSMPLIQFLTLNGFAVFVPNVRGSTGYGFEYMNHVVRDWGGQDRLDHVHAISEFLAQDSRLDTKRAGVMGRSYGGFMTLTQIGRHPELWAAAVDMFGPYDMLTFLDRVPETWKPHMAALVGDPATEQDFLVERSPKTYIDAIRCPLLVIQGANDPRILEQESRELVADMQQKGKDVEIIVFEDEGHDVLKFVNKVRCYNAITDFFKEHLMTK